MKIYRRHSVITILMLIFSIGVFSTQAQENRVETGKYITISGIVKDSKSKKELENVNISVSGTSTGTVTNEDGRFTIKIADSISLHSIDLSHIGYQNKSVRVGRRNIADITIFLDVLPKELHEVVFQYRDPQEIVAEALGKVADNYSPDANLLTGFYRETVKKRRNYIDISEAVIDIYKTSYDNNITSDRVRIIKGRKLLSQKPGDTLSVKLVGGPSIAVVGDVVKNSNFLLDRNTVAWYEYKHEDSEIIDGRTHYVISLKPVVIQPFPLHHGLLFIDRQTLTISRADFYIDMSDKKKVTSIILRRKPAKLRFTPVKIHFIVSYKQHNGKSYLNYIQNEIEFKCDWKRRLFATNYTVVSEMVVTDIQKDNIDKISRRQAFDEKQALTDKVNDFYDPGFWKDYNIIEPSESLESAVNKLRKQYQ